MFPEQPSPQPALNAEAIESRGAKNMQLPGQIKDVDEEDDAQSFADMKVTPVATNRSTRSGGDFDSARAGYLGRQFLKVERGMSTDQLYSRRSGVSSAGMSNAQSQPDNFFAKKEEIQNNTFLGRALDAADGFFG
eukprot:Skav208376  [mRNA]  locus=scaffold3508:14087:16350:+ [translate_table: standard]